MDVCIRHAVVDAGVRHVQAYAKRANSEDSIEVLSTTESIFPDDLAAITEEDAERHPLTNGFENEEESQTECESDKVLTEERTLETTTSEPEDEAHVDTEEPVKDTLVSVGVSVKEDLDAEKKNEMHTKTCKLLQGNTSTMWSISEAIFTVNPV